jgi:hypothetical protein
MTFQLFIATVLFVEEPTITKHGYDMGFDVGRRWLVKWRMRHRHSKA